MTIEVKTTIETVAIEDCNSLVQYLNQVLLNRNGDSVKAGSEQSLKISYCTIVFYETIQNRVVMTVFPKDLRFTRIAYCQNLEEATIPALEEACASIHPFLEACKPYNFFPIDLFKIFGAKLCYWRLVRLFKETRRIYQQRFRS